jgi:hypothetical protein
MCRVVLIYCTDNETRHRTGGNFHSNSDLLESRIVTITKFSKAIKWFGPFFEDGTSENLNDPDSGPAIRKYINSLYDKQ